MRTKSAILAVLAVVPLLAHHSISAAFDEKKSVTLKGVVTKFDWVNPHVLTFVDVAGANGKVATWEVEWASTPEMKRIGWTRNSIKVGDSVTVDGMQARDGSTGAYGKTIAVGGKKLGGIAPDAPITFAAKKSGKPTPKLPDGHVRLGSGPGALGYWANPSVSSLIENSAGNIRMNSEGLLANIKDADKIAPFQPWAKALYEYRQKSLLKDDPMASCLPPGGPRQLQAPYGVQIVEDTARQRIFLMSGGANRNWRLINTDGRPLPDRDDLIATYFGNSTGKYEGDTLVVSVNGFVERFWFSNGGLPHTESLKLTERFSRPDFDTLKYEVTVDDTGAYTRPWSGGWTLQWIPEDAIQEYYCDEYNTNLLPSHAQHR